MFIVEKNNEKRQGESAPELQSADIFIKMQNVESAPVHIRRCYVSEAKAIDRHFLAVSFDSLLEHEFTSKFHRGPIRTFHANASSPFLTRLAIARGTCTLTRLITIQLELLHRNPHAVHSAGQLMNTLAMVFLLPQALRTVGAWEANSAADAVYWGYYPYQAYFVNVFGFCAM
ncbi:hypothetical protein OSTOST_21841, partial [Ostertagia ostertagi]